MIDRQARMFRRIPGGAVGDVAGGGDVHWFEGVTLAEAMATGCSPRARHHHEIGARTRAPD